VPGAPSLWHKVVTAGAAIALAVTPAYGTSTRAKAPAAKPVQVTAKIQGRVSRSGGPAPASWFGWFASEKLRP